MWRRRTRSHSPRPAAQTTAEPSEHTHVVRAPPALSHVGCRTSRHPGPPQEQKKTSPVKLKHLELHCLPNHLPRAPERGQAELPEDVGFQHCRPVRSPGKWTGTAGWSPRPPPMLATNHRITETTDATETSRARDPGRLCQHRILTKSLTTQVPRTSVDGGVDRQLLPMPGGPCPPWTCPPVSAHGPLLGTALPLGTFAPTPTEAVPGRSVPCDLQPAIL